MLDRAGTRESVAKGAGPRLSVIEGGALPERGADRAALRPLSPPNPGPVALAGDMAELWALSLLRDLPDAALADAHGTLRVDRGTSFTLHELLCELRNLPWFDAGSAVASAELGAPASGGEGGAGHRRALCWNGDGQLTLRTLMRSGVALRGATPAASRLWDDDHDAGGVAGAKPAPMPAETAPMAAWQAWCAVTSGAALRRPGPPAKAGAPSCPGDLARALPRIPAARPFHHAALAALARGALPLGPGSAHEPWTGPRLLALMAEAETRARRMAGTQALCRDRLPRPAVTAARMTLWLTRQEREAAPAHAEYRAAAEMLADHAPRLLHWVSRTNAARRGLRRPGLALFLPLAGLSTLEHGPADTAAHVVVAGALGTLLKALVYPEAQALHRIGAAAPGMADEADRLLRDIARARVISGACLPSEAFADMRLGQAIALHLLRDRLERDNRSARLALRDLDGRALVLLANPRHCGRGFAQLHADGQPVAWPQESAPPAAHLTRVV